MDSTELQREHIVKKGVLQRYSGSQVRAIGLVKMFRPYLFS